MAKKTASWTDDPERGTKDGEHLREVETAEPKRAAATIVLPRLDIRTLEITLVGESPLICHRWSAKARNEILKKQMGIPSAGKEHKDPLQDFIDSLYVIEPGKLQGRLEDKRPDGHPNVWLEGGRYGFPLIAFKNAAVTACTSLGKAISKVAARQAFHVLGELTEVFGTPRMREDMVRVGMGTSDIRFRGEFPEWQTTIRVTFNCRVLSGFAVGVGEWRPERDGEFGRFRVA
jgi:hypothetical protein